MDAKDLLLTQHAIVHSAAVSGARGGTLADRTFQVTDEQMRVRPAGQNSLAWLLWHVARAEDVFVHLIFGAGAQVHDETWRTRLGVDRPEFGAGMTPEEVAALTDTIDLAALREYRNAVGRRTRDVLRELPDSAWEGRIEPADMQRAGDAGALGRAAAPLTQFFTGQRRAVLLPSILAIHTSEHIGEALTVRSLGGFSLGV
ncbi:MAG: DinB family protein [Candidatus Rokubacteria bacterium]|nr:DinB family protein [Candidatus Rokubacteria bacterium]